MQLKEPRAEKRGLGEYLAREPDKLVAGATEVAPIAQKPGIRPGLDLVRSSQLELRGKTMQPGFVARRALRGSNEVVPAAARGRENI